MRWASAVSDEQVTEHAVAAASKAVRDQLGGTRADLVIAFVSPHHGAAYDQVPILLGEQFLGALAVGCSAGGVIGGGQEVEHRAGFSITAASLPDVTVTPFHLESKGLPDADQEAAQWEQALGVAHDADPAFLILPDPFTFDAEALLRGLDRFYAGCTKVGGLASGGRAPGSNALWLGGRMHRTGAVGVALSGNVTVDSIVAQGCRPIGTPMFVTRCKQNLLFEVDGRPVMQLLNELFQALPRRDQDLLRTSLFLGVVMHEDQQEYRQGDFLIRNVLGQDRESGGLLVGALLRERQVVQFHLRDAETSRDDLDTLLERYGQSHADGAPVGAMLFSCLGRGVHLYGRANHDTELFRERLGPSPLGGFFCNGEIGPVGGTTFLHGYTSSFGLFRPKR